MEEDQIVDVAVETTPANTVVETVAVKAPASTSTTGIRSVRVASRNFTNDGNILFVFDNGLKAILNKEQIGTLLMIGEAVPKPGATVLIEDSVNPVTGDVNQTWAKLSL